MKKSINVQKLNAAIHEINVERKGGRIDERLKRMDESINRAYLQAPKWNDPWTTHGGKAVPHSERMEQWREHQKVASAWHVANIQPLRVEREALAAKYSPERAKLLYMLKSHLRGRLHIKVQKVDKNGQITKVERDMTWQEEQLTKGGLFVEFGWTEEEERQRALILEDGATPVLSGLARDNA